MKKIALIAYICLITVFIIPQTGGWNPAGANLTYPRTLLTSTSIPSVIQSLSKPEIKELYKEVYAKAISVVPVGNTSDDDRLSRSQIAKNASFVILLNKKVENDQIVDLSLAESEVLKLKVITLLADLNTAIGTFPNDIDTWQWRSKEIIDYVSAYDLLRGAGVSDALLTVGKTKLCQFTGNLYGEATKTVFFTNFFLSVRNNHALMTAAAFGFAAVVLNDAVSLVEKEKPINWINAAMWNIDNIFFYDIARQSIPGVIGGYSEGTYYFKYAMINVLPFFKAMGNFLPDGSLSYTFSGSTKDIRNPYHDTNYNYLYEWARGIRLPDGTMPPIEDSYLNRSFQELALLGKSEYNWNVTFNNGRIDLSNGGSDTRANYIASNTPVTFIDESLFKSFPESGNVVFRSSWNSDATYMHITAKNGSQLQSSLGHNQADVTSFLIYGKGEMLALDPGYLKYTRRTEVGRAKNHNMILVDGMGPEIGEPTNANEADGFIQNSFSVPKMSYSEVKSNYLATDVLRKTIFLRDSYFIIADFVNATAPRSFQWQLHGNGLEGGLINVEGEFVPDFTNQKGVWNKNNASLLVHSTSEGGAVYTKELSTNEIGYDLSGNHTVMQVTKSGSDNAAFLSALIPFENNMVPQTSTLSSDKSIIKVNNDGYTDIASINSSGNQKVIPSVVSGLPNEIKSDGIFITFSAADGNLLEYTSIFASDAGFMKYGNKELFTSDVKVNLALVNSSLNEIKGSVNKTSTVTIHTEFDATSVQGNNITSFEINGQSVVINFSGESTFRIGIGGVTGTEDPNTVSAFELMQNYPNPFNPSTTVKFNLPEGSFVTISIYNALGEKVIDLLEHALNAGVHSLSWNASSQSSGIYFVRMEAVSDISGKTFSSNKKIILMK